MKVKDLIRALQKYDGDIEVVYEDYPSVKDINSVFCDLKRDPSDPSNVNKQEWIIMLSEYEN